MKKCDNMNNFESIPEFKKLTQQENEYLRDLGRLTDKKALLLLVHNIKDIVKELNEIKKVLKNVD